MIEEREGGGEGWERRGEKMEEGEIQECRQNEDRLTSQEGRKRRRGTFLKKKEDKSNSFASLHKRRFF